MRPVQSRGLTAPAGHGDQESGEVAPDWFTQPFGGRPESCQIGQEGGNGSGQGVLWDDAHG